MPEDREPITIEIQDVAFGGKGVGRLPSGKAVFVPDVIPGERAQVVVGKVGRRFVEAKLDSLLEASPLRVKPPCPYFGTCGGCAYQHVEYSAQLELKRKQIEQVLRRIGGLVDPEVREVTGSPAEYQYRNRITVHRRGGRIGFYQRGGQGIVDVERCLLASEPVNEMLTGLRAAKRGRAGFADSGGTDAITLREHGGRYGFHQTNDAVAGMLLAAVDEAAGEGGPLLVDAYCGAGFFAKRVAGRFGKVVGIEWNEGSIEVARGMAGENEEYLAGDVAQWLGETLRHPEAGRAVVVLDPPSQGVDERVVSELLSQPVARLIYVSCDPSTLARDLKLLGGGYTLEYVQPFDMFAQTAEVEVMAVLRASGG
ncbi:MAG: TRAM domain-containing protein [Chthoniobacterales bacterium]